MSEKMPFYRADPIRSLGSEDMGKSPGNKEAGPHRTIDSFFNTHVPLGFSDTKPAGAKSHSG